MYKIRFYLRSILWVFLTIIATSAFSQEKGKIRGGMNVGYFNHTDFQIGYNLPDNLNVGFKFGLGDKNYIEENRSLKSRYYSYLGTCSYYFNPGENSFAPFVGGGIGIYDIRKEYDAYLDSWYYHEYCGSGEHRFQKFGGFLTAGFEVEKFRVAFEYNFVPKAKMKLKSNYDNNYKLDYDARNSYFGATVGFYIGGGQWKRTNRLSGFVDKKGDLSIPPNYDYVIEFSDGLARLKIKNKWGFVDENIKEVIPFKYKEVGVFSEEFVRVKFKGKWGFIDKTGRLRISFKYDEANDFSEGQARVKLNNKWIFIDKTGKEVFPIVPIVNQNEVQEEVITHVPITDISTSIPNVDTPKETASSTPHKFQFGINGGLYYVNEVSKYDGKYNESTNEYFPGFQLGFVGNVPLGKYFALQPCLLYAQQREVWKDGNEREKWIINHLQVPVNLQVKLGNTPIWLQTGPYIGYALWGKEKWKYEVAEGKFESGSLDIKIGNSKDDAFKPFDFGISSGVALKANNIQFSLNYMLGLANKSTSDNEKVKEKMNGVSFSATYFLGK